MGHPQDCPHYKSIAGCSLLIAGPYDYFCFNISHISHIFDNIMDIKADQSAVSKAGRHSRLQMPAAEENSDHEFSTVSITI